MKVTLKVDHENGRIVMNRTFANLAANVFSEEYKILQGARQDYPTYVVVRRTIKKNPNREIPCGTICHTDRTGTASHNRRPHNRSFPAGIPSAQTAGRPHHWHKVTPGFRPN